MNEAEILDFMGRLAKESGELILPYFANPQLIVETKSDHSLVTVADRDAEELMRSLISKEYPDHGIIGEEFGSENSDARFVWILDPIDGTRSFVAGCPLFGTLICLLEYGQPVIGAIHNPVTRQLLVGNGEETSLNGIRVRMRSQSQLGDAVLLASNLRSPREFQDTEGWDMLVGNVGEIYTWGDCYGYLLLAIGRADIMVDPIMNPWDLLPLIPLIRGAGGIITDWQGRDPVLGNSIVAANPDLHPQVLARLNP